MRNDYVWTRPSPLPRLLEFPSFFFPSPSSSFPVPPSLPQLTPIHHPLLPRLNEKPGAQREEERKRERERKRGREKEKKGWAEGVVKVEAPKVNQRNIISLIQTPGCNGADECLRRVPLVHPPIAKRATPIRWRGNIYLDNLTGCTGRNHCLRLIGSVTGRVYGRRFTERRRRRRRSKDRIEAEEIIYTVINWFRDKFSLIEATIDVDRGENRIWKNNLRNETCILFSLRYVILRRRKVHLRIYPTI